MVTRDSLRIKMTYLSYLHIWWKSCYHFQFSLCTVVNMATAVSQTHFTVIIVNNNFVVLFSWSSGRLDNRLYSRLFFRSTWIPKFANIKMLHRWMAVLQLTLQLMPISQISCIFKFHLLIFHLVKKLLKWLSITLFILNIRVGMFTLRIYKVT